MIFFMFENTTRIVTNSMQFRIEECVESSYFCGDLDGNRYKA